MQIRSRVLSIIIVFAVSACASIPSEAPELSEQLGTRISAIEAAHTRLVEQFFAEKKRRVDEFIQDQWVPTFAKEFFSDPEISEVWQQVVASGDPNDRLQFITLVGPKLQAKINRKRLELVRPLEELEMQVKAKLRSEYDQARAINNTLTAFLQSASQVDENRKRYLDLIGVKQDELNAFIDDTDTAVSNLVDTAKNAQDKVKSAQEFIDQLKTISDKIKS